MSVLSNPHDKFFKKVFSHVETAKDFLLNYLPAELSDLIDPDSLELSKDSFIDKDLKTYFSDLLYKVCLKDGPTAYIYILFEHKSYQEPLVAFHILKYMVRIWEMSISKGEKKSLPIIIPFQRRPQGSAPGNAGAFEGACP